MMHLGGFHESWRNEFKQRELEEGGWAGDGFIGVISRRHSKEFKLEAVALSRQPGMTVAKAARDLGISENMLHRWRSELKEYTDRAFRGHGRRRVLESEVERLVKEDG